MARKVITHASCVSRFFSVIPNLIRNPYIMVPVIVSISIACLASYIMIVPSAPAERVLKLNPADTLNICATLPFRAPQNIAFERVAGADDTLRITWDRVAGATGYNVYSRESQPDSTTLVPYVLFVSEINGYRYMYSYHPRYGDTYGHLDHDSSIIQNPLRMYKKMTLTPWVKMNTTPITQTKYDVITAIEQRSSVFYCVTAVR